MTPTPVRELCVRCLKPSRKIMCKKCVFERTVLVIFGWMFVIISAIIFTMGIIGLGNKITYTQDQGVITDIKYTSGRKIMAYVEVRYPVSNPEHPRWSSRNEMNTYDFELEVNNTIDVWHYGTTDVRVNKPFGIAGNFIFSMFITSFLGVISSIYSFKKVCSQINGI